MHEHRIFDHSCLVSFTSPWIIFFLIPGRSSDIPRNETVSETLLYCIPGVASEWRQYFLEDRCNFVIRRGDIWENIFENFQWLINLLSSRIYPFWSSVLLFFCSSVLLSDSLVLELFLTFCGWIMNVLDNVLAHHVVPRECRFEYPFMTLIC